MEYISHEDYKKMLGSFGKEAPKKALNEMHTMQKDDGPSEFQRLPADFDEGLEKEGNAFTAGLAKTKRGGEFKVGDRSFKDNTNYDAPLEEDGKTEGFLDQVYDILNDEMRANEIAYKDFENAKKFLQKHGEALATANHDPHKTADAIIRKISGLDEYQFDQMYPDDPGPFEGVRDICPVCEKDPCICGVEERLREFLAKEGDTNWEAIDNDEAEENETDNGIEEDINLPSSQATGPSIEETRRPLSHLSPEERDQLKQYVETIKTVKEQINKMVGKSGMEEGGNMTNLIMRPSKMREDDEMIQGAGSHEEIGEKLNPKLHHLLYKVLGLTFTELMAAGFDGGDIKNFLQQEIDNKAREYTMSQYDSN